MAQAGNSRPATGLPVEIDDNSAKIRVEVQGIAPPLFGDKTKPKNGTLDVKFYAWSIEMRASVKGTHWHYGVKKLPSEIDPQASTYKVKDNLVELILRKKQPMSWVSIISGPTGLDQANSDSSDDE